MKTVWQLGIKLSIYSLSESATPILCFHPKEIKTYVHKKEEKKKENLGRNVHSRFIRKNSNLKDVGHLPTGGHVYAKKYYSAVKRTMHPTTWANPTDFVLSVRN